MDGIERKQFVVDIGFTKSATPTGDLELKGYASTWIEDRDNEIVARDAFKSTLNPYLSSNPILLWQHDQSKPIGTVREALVDTNGLQVKAYIPKPDDNEPDWAHLAYHKVKKGVVRTFSIGGVFHKAVEKGKKTIRQVDLMEISVVSVPSNPRSIFECAVKSFDGPLRPELSTEAIGQMEMLIGMKSISDPELASMSDGELRERYDELASLYRDSGRVPPGLEEWRPISSRVRRAGNKTPTEVFEAAAGAVEMVKRVRGEVPVEITEETVKRLVEVSNLLADFLEQIADGKRFNPRQPRDSHGRWTETGPDLGRVADLPAGSPGRRPPMSNDEVAELSRVAATWTDDPDEQRRMVEGYMAGREGMMPARPSRTSAQTPGEADEAVVRLKEKLPQMPLYDIADEIEADWGKQGSGVNYAARPYLNAMRELESVSDNYYADSGRSVVAYFLSNASSWRGPKAKVVKDELKRRLRR